MRNSSVFRPRLPLDPFHDALPPWQCEPDADAEPHTVLVLGAPSHADLGPLVCSPRLASTLVLIATHTPPPVPDDAQCPIVVLRLPTPLDIHDAGAVRLVALLDRAQRVAHTWHAAPHAQPRIQQLAELYPGGDFSIAEPPEFALPSDAQQPTPESRPDASETSSLSSIVSSSSSSVYAPRQPAPPKGQYTFSALVNFLPAMLPDKALLKHAILVTTLSAPFLAPQPPLLPYTKRRSIFSSLSLSSTRPRSRFSLFTRQPLPASTPSSLFSSSTDSLAARPARNTHIVHVLPYSAAAPTRCSTPQPKSKLTQSIEQFLLSFAYPPTASSSAPSLASLSAPAPPTGAPPVPVPAPAPAHRAAPARSSPLASPAGSLRAVHTAVSSRRPATALSLAPAATAPPAVPFLLPAGLLGACPPGCTRPVGEMVLCGMLDRVAAGAGAGTGGGEGVEGGWPRAWIGGRCDVVVSGAGMGAPSLSVDPAFGPAQHVQGDEGAAPAPAHPESHTDADTPPPPPHHNGKHKKKRTRRNEAGLPTPPESDDDDDDGACPSADHSDAGTDADEEGGGDGTEYTHATHLSSAPVRSKTRWGRAKARSEAHVSVRRAAADADAGREAPQKGKVWGEKVYRVFGVGGGLRGRLGRFVGLRVGGVGARGG